jgi:hypothetical protein
LRGEADFGLAEGIDGWRSIIPNAPHPSSFILFFAVCYNGNLVVAGGINEVVGLVVRQDA